MTPVTLTEVTTTGPRVRMDGCPGCGRSLRLEHCGGIHDSGRPYLDTDRVALAQRLHLRACTG